MKKWLSGNPGEPLSMDLVYNPSEGRVSDTDDLAYYHCTALGNGFIKYLVD